MRQSGPQQLSHLPANRQPNPQTAIPPGHRTVDLEEPLVQGRLLQIIETDTTVADGKGQRQIIRPHPAAAHLDHHTALMGEL
ncbi:hypothetical protein D9M71_714970 [compost metagenome]